MEVENPLTVRYVEAIEKAAANIEKLVEIEQTSLRRWEEEVAKAAKPKQEGN